MVTELDQDDLDRIKWVDTKLLGLRMQALRACTMIPGCKDKRFAHTMAQRMPEELTEAEARQVLRLVWKYRRQIKRHLVPDINPDDPFADPRTGSPYVPEERAANG